MSFAQTLAHATLEKIQTRFNLREVDAPHLTLTSPMAPAPVGALRLFHGTQVAKLVYISLALPPIGLDSHMIFAFTPADSVLPHFTLDAVMTGAQFAFHLDLIPRVDLGANLPYIDAVFEPLTAAREAAQKIAGLTPAQLSLRQHALFSPWTLAYRATEPALEHIPATVAAYLDHWCHLLQNGLPAEAAPSGDHAARDRRHRAAIFDPNVDKVWAQVERLVGADTSARLRTILRTQD